MHSKGAFRLRLEPHADVRLTGNMERRRDHTGLTLAIWSLRSLRDRIGDELAERTRGWRLASTPSLSRRALKFGSATPAIIAAASWLDLW
jgi:hypothetical protein